MLCICSPSPHPTKPHSLNQSDFLKSGLFASVLHPPMQQFLHTISFLPSKVAIYFSSTAVHSPVSQRGVLAHVRHKLRPEWRGLLCFRALRYCSESLKGRGGFKGSPMWRAEECLELSCTQCSEQYLWSVTLKGTEC